MFTFLSLLLGRHIPSTPRSGVLRARRALGASTVSLGFHTRGPNRLRPQFTAHCWAVLVLHPALCTTVPFAVPAPATSRQFPVTADVNV